jgi:hypothetical protein
MIEVLKQMVKALEANRPINYCENGNGERFPMFENNPFRQEANEKAIQAGKQAIADLESQEPLGYIASMALNDMRDGIYGEVRVYHEELGGSIPIYTRPPQRTRVDLTNDEIALIHADNPHPQGFARAILAKSKEKNT